MAAKSELNLGNRNLRNQFVKMLLILLRKYNNLKKKCKLNNCLCLNHIHTYSKFNIYIYCNKFTYYNTLAQSIYLS